MTDPITADLVNALRYQIKYHPEHTVGMCSDALAAFDAAKDVPKANVSRISNELTQMAHYVEVNPDNAITDTLWHGPAETMMDALLRLSDEVGELDAAKDAPEDDTLTAESMARSASWLKALWAKDAEIAALRAKLYEVQETLHTLADMMDLPTGEDDSQFLIAGVACLLERGNDARAERDAALKSTQPNLQPLHDLVTEWKARTLSYSDDEYDEGLVLGFSRCVNQLEEVIAKIQSAGGVKPAVEVTETMIKAASESCARDDEGDFPPLCDLIDYSGENKTRTIVRAAIVAALKAVK